MVRSTLVEDFLKAHGVTEVVQTNTTLILWFDDGKNLIIEASLSESESLRIVRPRLDVDIVDKIVVREPNFPYKIQVEQGENWKDYDRPKLWQSYDIQALERAAKDISRLGNMPCKLRIVKRDGTVMMTIQHGKIVEANYQVEWFSKETQESWISSSQPYATLSKAGAAARRMSKDRQCMTRVTSGTGRVRKVFNNGMIEANVMSPYFIENRVASDEPWTDVDNQDFEDLSKAMEKARDLSRNAIVYGMVAVTERSTGRRVAIFTGGNKC